MHLALIAAGVLDNAGDQSEQGVVLATADVLAGVEVGTTLTNKNLASIHGLASKTLATESLRMRVAPVAARTEAFLMCHMNPKTLKYTKRIIENFSPLKIVSVYVIPQQNGRI